MAWIGTIDEPDARGTLAELYDAARARAGRVYQVLKLQSLNPPVLKAFVDLYTAVMHGPSPLSRAQREMLAVVVSSANECHY